MARVTPYNSAAHNVRFPIYLFILIFGATNPQGSNSVSVLGERVRTDCKSCHPLTLAGVGIKIKELSH